MDSLQKVTAATVCEMDVVKTLMALLCVESNISQSGSQCKDLLARLEDSYPLHMDQITSDCVVRLECYQQDIKRNNCGFHAALQQESVCEAISTVKSVSTPFSWPFVPDHNCKPTISTATYGSPEVGAEALRQLTAKTIYSPEFGPNPSMSTATWREK
jgi:hypothetical protein